VAARKDPDLGVIAEPHDDAQRCAEIAGLHYVHVGEPGIRRRRHGKGFAYYRDARNHRLNGKIIARVQQLAIPPAWKSVWINADERGHLLATGDDDRGCTKCGYHPNCARSATCYMDHDECELLAFLQVLLKREFDRDGIGR
jgi:DNA topoisomerase IB